MTIFELGAIGEIVGSIAVVASLIYVGLQVRQNSNAVHAASVIQTKQLASSISSMLSTPGMADVYLKGLKDSSGLTKRDKVLFNSLMLTLFGSYEASFFQSYYGTIPADILDPINAQAVFHLKRKGVRQWWDAGGRDRFGRRFVDGIEFIVNNDT